MKKKKLSKHIGLAVILLFLITSIESSLGRNEVLFNNTSDFKESIAEISSAEGDMFGDIAIINIEDPVGRLSICLGDGNGGFSVDNIYTGGRQTKDITTDDFNNDGILDLALATRDGDLRIYVYLGLGYGLFDGPKYFSTSYFPHGIATGDFNNDSNIDIAVCCVSGNHLIDTLDVFLGYGNGSFKPRCTLELEYETPLAIISDDFNMDGILDLAIAQFYLEINHLSILFGNGTGEFYFGESYYVGHMYHWIKLATGDFNLDGFPDIAIPRWGSDNFRIYFNDGNGEFTNYGEYYTGERPKSIFANDFNLDGAVDLAVTIKNYISIHLNNKTDGFEDPVYYLTEKSVNNDDLVSYDFTGDGFLDLVASNWEESKVTFYRGYGDGTFGERQDSFAENNCIYLTAGNFNPVLVPDLNCIGSLSWNDVEPDSNVSGSFYVENTGDTRSHLNWEVESYPEWGTWTIFPTYGVNLSPENGTVTVNITVVAPDKKNSDFTGDIKIVNVDNTSDFCTIDVSLSTPKNKSFVFNFPLLTWLFESFQNVFPILRYILGI